MIVLDTNVLSELMRPVPDPQVLKWTKNRSFASLFTTTITQAEILYGVALLKNSKRKESLIESVEEMFEKNFAGRILPFDIDAARIYSKIASSRRLSGQPISQFDAQIAAITRSRAGSLATRNIRDFTNCGIEVMNPWSS